MLIRSEYVTSDGYVGNADGILYPTETEAREANPNN